MNDSASPVQPRDGAIDHDVAVCVHSHLHTLAFYVLYVNAVYTVGGCKGWKLTSYIFTWPTVLILISFQAVLAGLEWKVSVQTFNS